MNAVRSAWSRVESWEPDRTLRLVLTAVAITLGFVVFLARRRGVVSHPMLFAEDGPIFFRGNRLHGVAALNDAYAGYLVIGPRVGALLASLLPIAWTPLFFAVFAAVCAVGACSLVFNERTAWFLGGWAPRAAVFFALLLLPQVSETHATLTNVMWWGGIALLLVGIADDPATTTARVFEGTVVAAVLVSGPIGLVFSPVIVWRWWRTRSTWSAALVGLWALLGAVQVFILRGQHRDVGRVPWSSTIARVLVQRWFGPFAIGADYVQEHLNGPGWSRTTWWSTVLFMVLVVVVAVRANARFAGVLLLLLGALHTIAGFVAMGPLAHLLPDRYTVGAGGAVVLLAVGARPREWWSRGAQVALIVWMLVVWPGNVAVPERVGPSFAPAARCLEHHTESCRVPVFPEPFSLDVPPGQ
jgi:hypothetical protein